MGRRFYELNVIIFSLNHFSSLNNSLPKVQLNSSLKLNGSVNKCWSRQFFMDCAAKKPKSSQKLSTFGKLIVGGTSAAALAFRCNRFVVSCNANRLAGSNSNFHRVFLRDLQFYVILGYQTNAIKNDTVAFDWRKFWHYLKPHLLKFLGAIAVSKLP